MTFVLPLSKISKSDVKIAGGKGASLGEMLRLGIPVPPGFVVLASAFDRFLEETDIGVEVKAQFEKVNLEDQNSIDNCSRTIQGLIENYEMPANLSKEILEAFDKLATQNSNLKSQNLFVAVRSSATAEDSSVASFAGQLETFLYTNRSALVANVQKCWASLFSQRAIFYRFEKNLHHSPISVGVVVQKMLDAEVSGVCFTVHPVTKDKNQMVIEAGWGLGESIVQGIITPDTYVIEKIQNAKVKSQNDNLKFKILDTNISEQNKKIVYKPGGGTQEVPVPRQARDKQKLSNEKILELAKICLKIEQHYRLPQDIEWGLENLKLYILQSRPITTL